MGILSNIFSGSKGPANYWGAEDPNVDTSWLIAPTGGKTRGDLNKEQLSMLLGDIDRDTAKTYADDIMANYGRGLEGDNYSDIAANSGAQIKAAGDRTKTNARLGYALQDMQDYMDILRGNKDRYASLYGQGAQREGQRNPGFFDYFSQGLAGGLGKGLGTRLTGGFSTSAVPIPS